LRRIFSAAIPLALAVGCASIIDVKDLRAPDADGGSDVTQPVVDAAAVDANDASACNSNMVTNLVLTPRGVHTAVDDTDVYFTRGDPPKNSAILRCSKCGCENPTVLVSKLGLPSAIAVDDRFVYWTDSSVDGSVNRMEKANPASIQSLAHVPQPIGIAVDDEHVYWTVLGEGTNILDTSGIFRAKKTDFSDVTRLTASASLPDDFAPYAIGVDATDVYYTTAPDLDDTSGEQPCKAKFGTIRRVAKLGTAMQTSVALETGQACPIGLAMSDDTLYWIDLGAGTGIAGDVMSRPKSGGTTTKLADNQGRPSSIAYHAGHLTWAAPAALAVFTCLATDCASPSALADEQHNPSGISADDSGIYWVVLGTVAQNFGDGALRRAPPP
jgi:hypothetical protein